MLDAITSRVAKRHIITVEQFCHCTDVTDVMAGSDRKNIIDESAVTTRVGLENYTQLFIQEI